MNIAIMILGFALFILQTGSWESIPPLPTARQEVGVAAIEGRVFVVGGLDAAGTPKATVEIFDTGSGLWQTGPELPVAVHHPNVAAVGTKVYVAGGYAGPVGLPSSMTFELDIDRMMWTQKADMPTPRGAGAAVGYNGRVYVFGGERGITVADVAVLDPAANTWSTRAPMPTPRNHMGAGIVRGKIYVIGGRPGNLNVNETYDPLTDTWTTKAPMPTARSGHAVTSFNNFVFAFGGEGNANSPAGTFPEVEAYNPDLDSWATLQQMPTPRHGIGAAVVGNRIFLPGGATVQGFGATSNSDFFAVQQELLLPQFVVGGGYSSSITVTNPEQSRTAEATVSLLGSDGMPLETNLNGRLLSTIRLTIPPLASRTVTASEPSAATVKVGIARLTADARVGAYTSIRGVGPPLNVYPASPARKVIFDARSRTDTGLSTGVAIANISTQPASLTIQLHNSNGQETHRVDRTLAAGEQFSRFIHQLFPDLQSTAFEGAITIQATQQLAVAAFAFDASGVVTIPVLPIE